MKKFLSLFVILGLLGGGGYMVWYGTQKRLVGLVDELKDFQLPPDPYKDPVVREFMVNKRTKEKKKITVIEPWEFEHGNGPLVRSAWGRRKEGTLPGVIAAAKDATLAANHRIAAMLVLGFSDDTPKERAEIVATLVGLLAEEPNRIAEFAAFALGCQGRKTPPAHRSIGTEAAKVVLNAASSESARYYALIALRDHRATRGAAEVHGEDPSKAIVAALKDPSNKIRALAAGEAWRVKGLEVAGTKVHEELFRLLADPDQAISDAARESLRFKAAELPQPATDFEPKCREAYGSAQVHTRANAIHVLNFLNAEGTRDVMTTRLPKMELYETALQQDGDKPAVYAAVVEGLAHFGPKETQVKMAHLLVEDGTNDLVVDAVAAGFRELSAFDAIAGILTEALSRPSPKVKLAAATICKRHGVKAHVPALIPLLAEGTDEALKTAGLAALQAISGNNKLTKPEEFTAWAAKR